METVKQLPEIINKGKPQSVDNITYAHKITRNTSKVLWKSMTAKNVYDLQRALTGLYPLTTTFHGTIIKLFGVKLIPGQMTNNNFTVINPGVVLYEKKMNLLIVQCSDGNWVSIEELLLPNRRKITARDFKNGFMKDITEQIIFESTNYDDELINESHQLKNL